MVGQDAGAGKHAVGLAVGGHLPVGRGLGHRIGAAGPHRRVLRGRRLPRVAKTLRTARTEEADATPQEADYLQQIQRGSGDRLQALHRLVKRQTNARLPRQVVDLIRLYTRHHLQHAAEVVRRQRHQLHVALHPKPLQARGIGHLGIAAAAHHPVAQPKQVVGQIGAVLACDACDQGCFLPTRGDHVCGMDDERQPPINTNI